MDAGPVNCPLAFHLRGTGIRGLRPCRAAGRALPARLVIPPGVYRVHGRNYRLGAEGLYRFLFPGKGNQQRIVHRRDPVALLSGLSWISTHGSRDNPSPFPALRRAALTRKLVVTCGRVSEFGRQLLARAGIPARVVWSFTLRPTNTYDTGHTMLEVRLGRRWTLVDLDANRLFRRRGKRLSLLEMSEAVEADDFELQPLSAATGTAIGGFTQKGYDYGLWMDTIFVTEPWIRRWYRRVLRIPVLHADGGLFFTVRGSARRRAFERAWEKLKPVWLSRREFVRRFYLHS